MDFLPYPWQTECLNKWIENNYTGIADVVTGAGKTRLAMLAIAYLRERCALPVYTFIVVPTCSLMDQWVKGIKETFGFTQSVARVGDGFYGKNDAAFQVMVVNSARRILPHRRNALLAKNCIVFLICDECHHYGSKENRKIFDGISLGTKNYYTLGLSATPENRFLQSVLLPSLGNIIFHYGHEQALLDGIISPFIIEQIAVSMDASELSDYTELSDKIGPLIARLFGNSSSSPNISSEEFFKHLYSLKDAGNTLAETLLTLLYKRKALVLLARSRLSCVLHILNALPSDNRIIVFCERIQQADILFSYLEDDYRYQIGKYHSGRDSAQNRGDLRKFRDGDIRILIACKALDEGIDVPDADIAIVASCSSVNRQHIQRLGRILRLGSTDNKLGTLYYLYVKESSEEACYLSEYSDNKQVVNLKYSSLDGFSCEEYEQQALLVLNSLKEKNIDPQQFEEAKSCILEGLILSDWKRSPSLLAVKASETSTKSIHQKNYWHCMQWMAGDPIFNSGQS